MSEIKLLPHQQDVMEKTKEYKRVAYYLDMGLGKTFVGSEKMNAINNPYNLVVCQKSKIEDWIEHFKMYYPKYDVIDGRKTKNLPEQTPSVVVVNYDLTFRKRWQKWLAFFNSVQFTLMLDESSMVKNEKATRSKTMMSLEPDAVILLSGTPTGGKYEELYSQMYLLGWRIDKNTYYDNYMLWRWADFGGFKFKQVYGYRNVDRLKRKLREHGAVFMKTDEVIDLPKQNFIKVSIPTIPEYKEFMKESVVIIQVDDENIDLVGDNPLTKLLNARQLCGQYNKAKFQAFEDLINSTNDRLIVFYNFTMELEQMLKRLDGRPYSVVNGSVKDLNSYTNTYNSITFVQYQAGAMGLNLQKANKIVYFTPPLSSELYEQSKKRIHRIGQEKPCYYYQLICKGSVEERIYKALAMRKDYTDELFREDFN